MPAPPATIAAEAIATTASRRTLSVIVPFFNEGDGVEAFHRGLEPVRAALVGISLEIVCVDDGSTDDTLAKLQALAMRDAAYRVVELSRNFGKEAALTAGLDEAGGDAVVVMDADLQDPPALVIDMVRCWRAGADVVLARRADRSCDGWFKRQSAQWFYRMHNAVADIRIPQDVGDFRLMDRKVVDALKTLPERQRFMKGLFCWVGFRTEVLDYERAPRAVGTTKFAGWKLWNLALEGITSFSSAPLRMWTYLGLACAALTSAYALFIFLRALFWGMDLPGYASLLLVALFFGSVQLISLGLLGEYIGRIYNESKQRPVYLVRSRFAKPQPPVRAVRAAASRHAHALATGRRRAAPPALVMGHDHVGSVN
ncbi:MAG: glycosyltransferase family 2 protein [Ramlibacter sp.]|nr:glycosyltransferase family 2 protein [Ramlibacter sp.]